MSDVVELAPVSQSLATTSRAAAFLELTKPRIAAMVLVAASVGYQLSRSAGMEGSDLLNFAAALIGIGLVAAGANALNQLAESRYDALMERTRGRPIPTGRLTRSDVLRFGLGASAAGLAWLLLVAGPLAALLCAATLISYVFVYTPIKRVTRLCVYLGAVPGALPPLIGWAAGAGTLAPEAWYLFAILYFWQLPHFAAIAWQYRDDYARGGYPMLSVGDETGVRTCRHMMTHTVALVTASLIPVFASRAGTGYALWAMLLGTGFLAFGALFAVRRSKANARAVVIASVVYLPMLLMMLMADHTPF